MLIVATPFNLKPTDTARSASYLDLHLEIDNANKFDFIFYFKKKLGIQLNVRLQQLH
jgi:hypothetical protein